MELRETMSLSNRNLARESRYENIYGKTKEKHCRNVGRGAASTEEVQTKEEAPP
jgi:hypothetical protein